MCVGQIWNINHYIKLPGKAPTPADILNGKVPKLTFSSCWFLLVLVIYETNIKILLQSFVFRASVGLNISHLSDTKGFNACLWNKLSWVW